MADIPEKPVEYDQIWRESLIFQVCNEDDESYTQASLEHNADAFVVVRQSKYRHRRSSVAIVVVHLVQCVVGQALRSKDLQCTNKVAL